KVYADARIEPERHQPFGWALEVIPCGVLSITSGAWGGGARVVLPAGSDRHVLTFSRGERAGGEQAGQDFAMISGRSAAVFSPGLPATLHGKSGFQGWNVVIEPAALQAHLSALTGEAVRAPIVFDPALDLES